MYGGGGNHEEVSFARDCETIMVPDGIPMAVSEGTAAIVMQVLGGNFTLRIATGHMVRLSADDADAIGKKTEDYAAAPGLQDVTETTEEVVWEMLKTIYDPEIPVNIVELGLIYKCTLQPSESEETGHQVSIDMTLTAPGCGMGQVLVNDVERRVASLPQLRHVSVEMVFDPPWTPDRMSEAAQLELGF